MVLEFSMLELEEMYRALMVRRKNLRDLITEHPDDPDWSDWHDYVSACSRAAMKVDQALLEGTKLTAGKGWRKPGSDDA